MTMTTLHDLFVHELRDLYSAEKQLVRALPKMAKAASSEELAAAFEEHLGQTEEHVRRLEEVFTLLDVSSRSPKCVAMEGLVEEGSKFIDQDADTAVLDAGLIAAAQKVEHYEIAGYGTVATYAAMLDESEVERLLRQTLDEEKATDQKLTDLAESEINMAANVEE
jgi:ferritin-like metal-binding protein YciE